MEKLEKEKSIMQGKGEWDEAEHPRDEDGKFTNKDGGTSQAATQKPIAKVKTKERVCTLKTDLYSKIFGKQVVNSDMIISLDNIAHIKNRHGELYEKYKDQLPDIINDPDYVFDARVPNRALAVKKYQESLAVVLELSFENPKFSNKIVTMWEVTDKELLKLEQKRILMYKKT